MKTEQGSFPHRRNQDGSFDSICPVCYLTVMTRASEADLAAAEHNHICADEDIPPHGTVPLKAERESA